MLVVLGFLNFARDSTHDFNTQSGGALRLPFLDSERRSESIFGIQSAPRFQAIYGVESVPRFQPIFGIRSAPPPAFKLYMVLKACPPRFQPIFGTQSAPPLSSSIWCWERALLSTHIWHSERPPAFKLYFVLKAGPYLVFRASEQRGALNAKYGLKAGHALNTIYRFKAEGRSECQIWTWSAALSLKMGVKGFHIVN